MAEIRVGRNWHPVLFETLARNGTLAARRVLDVAIKSGKFSETRLLDHVARLVIERAEGEPRSVELTEAALAALGENAAERAVVNREVLVAAHLLAGVMQPEARERAKAHFVAALSFAPDFLPAKVELARLARGVGAADPFMALGEPIHREDWRYLAGAAELGIPLDLGPAPPTAGAICLRGLCTAETPALLRLYRALNPGTPMFLATWDDTPRDLVDELSSYAKVCLVADPPHPGSQNKNRQITLARAVLAAAAGQVSHALLVRTDIALFAPHIVARLAALLADHPIAPGRLNSRIVISDVWTRRFIGFHFSDILGFGTIPDLDLFWNAPFETGDVHTYTEQYLGLNLAKVLGLQPAGEADLPCYYEMLRDLFVVRDFDAFEGLWLKHPILETADKFPLMHACVSQKDWERLRYSSFGLSLRPLAKPRLGAAFETILGLPRMG